MIQDTTQRITYYQVDILTPKGIEKSQNMDIGFRDVETAKKVAALILRFYQDKVEGGIDVKVLLVEDEFYAKPKVVPQENFLGIYSLKRINHKCTIFYLYNSYCPSIIEKILDLNVPFIIKTSGLAETSENSQASMKSIDLTVIKVTLLEPKTQVNNSPRNLAYYEDQESACWATKILNEIIQNIRFTTQTILTPCATFPSGDKYVEAFGELRKVKKTFNMQDFHCYFATHDLIERLLVKESVADRLYKGWIEIKTKNLKSFSGNIQLKQDKNKCSPCMETISLTAIKIFHNGDTYFKNLAYYDRYAPDEYEISELNAEYNKPHFKQYTKKTLHFGLTRDIEKFCAIFPSGKKYAEDCGKLRKVKDFYCGWKDFIDPSLPVQEKEADDFIIRAIFEGSVEELLSDVKYHCKGGWIEIVSPSMSKLYSTIQLENYKEEKFSF